MGRCLFLLLAPAMLAAQDCPTLDLDANGTAAGTLEAGHCLYRDLVPGSTSEIFVDRYRIETRSRGVLTLRLESPAFDTVLYLNDGRGARITQNGGIAPGVSRIVVSLNPGTYIVFVTSRVPAAGPYTLASSHEPLRECAAQLLTFGVPASGELSESDCRILDLRVPSADETQADVYTFALERHGFVRLDLTSADFNPYLALIDDQNRRIAVTDLSIPPPGAHIALGLEPGAYTVYANTARPAAGAYALAAALDDARPCPVAELTAGAPVSGVLTADGCRLADVLAPQPDTSPVNLYRLEVAESALFTFEMASNEFDTYLLLFDDQNRYIGEADDVSANNTNTRLTASIKPGAYLVMANTYRGVGAYTLAVTAAPLRTCPARDLAAGSTEGALETSACRVLDTVILSADPTPADVYRLTVTQPAVLTAWLTSQEFDAWLVLAAGGRDMIAQDDDGGGGTDSFIETLLLPGDYYLLANTTGGSGAYTLNAALRDAPTCSVAELRPGEAASGNLGPDDCRLLDAVPGDLRAARTALFRVTLAAPATLRVMANSPDFSPAILVLDGGWRARGKDARTLSSAEANVPLEAGVYTVAVAPASGAGGRFSLEASVMDGSKMTP